MKLKPGFILREIAGETIVVPSGNELELNMMITLNGTGKLLWKQLETGATIDELVQAILAEYEIDEQTARLDAEAFVAKMLERGFLE